MLQRSWKYGLFVVVFALGCGDDTKDATPDGRDTADTVGDASDVSPDTRPDTRPDDTADDTAGDTSDDTADDVDSDTRPDVEADVADDTAADGASDTSADTAEDTGTDGDTSEPPRPVYDPIPGHWSEDFAFSLPGLQAANGPRAYDMIREPASGDVFVGGIFDTVGALEGLGNVVRWNAQDGFARAGDGLALSVHALAADGAGAIFAAGRGQGGGGIGIPGPAPIARWDGASWTPIGWVDAFAPVWSLAWIDGELWVGGEQMAITSADDPGTTVDAAYLARWDGAAWHAVDAAGPGPDGPVYAIAKHGDEVCVGGLFAAPGSNVACWSALGGWRALGAGLDSAVHVLQPEGDGKLMAGGYFSFGDPLGPPEQFFVGLGRFTEGADAWAPVAGGVLNGAITNVWEIAPTGDGGYWIGGNFNHVNAAMPRVSKNFARLDGNQWTPLGDVTNELGVTLASEVGVRAVVPDGAGSFLAAGLFSTVAGTSALNIARFDGGKWSALVEVTGPNLGVAGNINSLAFAADGSLYVGGYFQSAGGVASPNIARFTLGDVGRGDAIVPTPSEPPRWHALGAGLNNTVWVVHPSADGDVYAGGLFDGGFARWDGARWQVPMPMDGDVRAIADLPASDGGGVVIGGTFTTIGLDDGLAHVARFDGAAFHAYGPGLDDRVNAVTVAPDGSVFAGGFFRGTGDYDEAAGTGVPLAAVARWNGQTWEDVGGGVDGFVRDFAWWGDDLVVVGQFERAGKAALSSIARWDGEAWYPIGEGTEWRYDWGGAMQLGGLAAQDNGFFVAGAFTGLVIGDTTFNGVAWWNGTTFEPLSEGPNDLAEDVVITPDGRAAFIGGGFLRVDGRPSLGLARWVFDAVAPEPR